MSKLPIFLATCLAASTAFAQQQAQPAPTTVVAHIGSTLVKLAELDAEAEDELRSARVAYRQQVDAIRQAALDALIERRVLEAEAGRRKLTVEAMLAEVDAKAPKPDAAALRAFYEEFKDRIQEPYEAVESKIVEALTNQAIEHAQLAFRETLLKRAKVTTALPVYRISVEAKGFGFGPADAPITVVMFADYECPYCAQGAEGLAAAAKKYPGKVRVVYRDYPLGFHEGAIPAAIAARCAGRQGKFMAMHEMLYAHQDALDAESIVQYAVSAGLNGRAFAACQEDPSIRAKITADAEAGEAVGVEGTPAFFVNGIKLGGAQPAEAFEALFARELARAQMPKR